MSAQPTAIDERQEVISAANVAAAEEVMRYLTAVMRDQEPAHRDRLRAAELLGKRYGMFTDKMMLDVVPVIISGVDMLED